MKIPWAFKKKIKKKNILLPYSWRFSIEISYIIGDRAYYLYALAVGGTKP